MLPLKVQNLLEGKARKPSAHAFRGATQFTHCHFVRMWTPERQTIDRTNTGFKPAGVGFNYIIECKLQLNPGEHYAGVGGTRVCLAFPKFGDEVFLFRVMVMSVG
jgi:hypothetical protein